jgi:hypothetical protein
MGALRTLKAPPPLEPLREGFSYRYDQSGNPIDISFSAQAFPTNRGGWSAQNFPTLPYGQKLSIARIPRHDSWQQQFYSIGRPIVGAGIAVGLTYGAVAAFQPGGIFASAAPAPTAGMAIPTISSGETLSEAQMIADLGGSPGFGADIVGAEMAVPTVASGETLSEAQMIADLGGSPGFGADVVAATNPYLDKAIAYAGKAAAGIGTSYLSKLILPSPAAGSNESSYSSYISEGAGGGGSGGGSGGGGSFTDMLANDDGSLNWKAYAIVAAIVAAIVIERKSLGKM